MNPSRGNVAADLVAFALGIGVKLGVRHAHLQRQKDYPVSGKGLSICRVGATSSSAYGEVLNLKHLLHFHGDYDIGGAGTRGATLGAGKTGTIMSNQAGVIVRVFLHSTGSSPSTRLAVALICKSRDNGVACKLNLSAPLMALSAICSNGRAFLTRRRD